MQQIDRPFGTIKIIGALLLLCVGGYFYLPSVAQRNAWSVLYLWQRSGHAPIENLPFSAALAQWFATPPASHLNAAIWQARATLAAGNADQAGALVAPALATGSIDALRLQGEIDEARGDFGGAIAAWQKIGDVDAINSAAGRAAKAKHLNEALLAYRTAYELNPENGVLPLARFLWQSDRDSASAESLLTQYVAAYPHSLYYINWLRELGTLYRAQNDWDKAANISDQLLAIAPDVAQDWIDRGWTYYGRGDGVQTALAQFQQALALDPNRGDAYLAMANLLAREKVYGEADHWYAQAVERAPDNSSWILARGQTAQNAGDLTKATEVYAEAQQRFPTVAQVHYQAAWAYRLDEQRPAAITAIETALGLLDLNDSSQRTSNGSYYARAGQIYEWAGALDKAAKAYDQAQQLDAQNQAAQDGLRRLRGN